MPALLFCDWITVRASMRQYLLAACAIAFVATATGLPDVAEGASALAAHIYNVIVSTGSMMLSFFVFFALFGADEREGWQATRLAFPITRRQVVAARYLTLLIAETVLIVVTSVIGVAVGAIACWWYFGAPAFQSISEACILCMTLLIIFLTYSALEMPIFFKQGLTKARIYFTLPFLLCMLAAFDPLRTILRGTIGALAAYADRLGSPWPIAAFALIMSLTIYVVSLCISQRIYRVRDF